MGNAEYHVDKKRKIDADDDSSDGDTDGALNLSLSLQPFVPTPFPSSNPQPASEPLTRLENFNSPRIFPRPLPYLSQRPPPIQVYLQSFPIPTPPSEPHSPESPPPPTYGPFYPIETRNSSMPSPRVPVYRQFLPAQPSLSLPLSPPPPVPPPSFFPEPSDDGDDHPRPARSRRNPSQLPRGLKSLEIAPPYPWATNRRARVHRLQHLLSVQIHTINGDVQCKKCERNYRMGFDLRQKSLEIFRFIIENKTEMHDRAPGAWMQPALPPCRFCEEENSVKPIISDKKQKVNWLFLLLGQMLCFCTLGQLKYFCKHTNNHRTGAKDRLLYLAYLGLCKQLDPNGPFDR